MVRILITGGTGYLGQHLLNGWEGHELAYTFNSADLPADSMANKAVAFQMNLVDARAVAAVVSTFLPDVIVHTAAQSSPAASSNDPKGATAVNAPSSLVDAIKALPPSAQHPPPLLVYISTDQVFSGSPEAGQHRPQPYGSDANPAPVNAYGASKLAFESMLLRENKSDGDGPPFPFVVLRSSNMVGPPAPYTGATKFLQWLEEKLSVGSCVNSSQGKSDGSPKSAEKEATVGLFEDEVRSFIHVHDVVKAVRTLVNLWAVEGNKNAVIVATRQTSPSPGAVGGCGGSNGSGGGGGEKCCSTAAASALSWRLKGGVYNMGGPQGLSRLGLAHALAESRPTECSVVLKDGHTPKVLATSRAALTSSLGYESPLDITMDSSKLEVVIGFAFRPMSKALAATAATASSNTAASAATTSS